ncbi:enhancer of split M2 protein [Drosophila ficusphila]|uniref:enhancer of split M2 protein n=1 Tax=Drosophila ficusphila TaxID=30025 RepID=UPI0007E87391|nr:enhancer of split M2 protein [Drosophila ficusphila]
MYLDTKNMTASNTSALTAATTPSNEKSARHMRKVWQPLRRLLKVGGGKGRTAQLTLAHPNNVDLNNTQMQQQQQQPELLVEDEPKSTPEESLHKYGLELRQLPEEEVSLTQPPNTPTLISSVYVDKVSAQSCGNCQHGRNCQHRHHSSSNSNSNTSSNINLNSSNSATQLPSNLWDLQLPLQYISTDNGTFFWANTQDRVDDDLLHALLCQSFSQMPGTLC